MIMVKKSIISRIKITTTGKMLRRKMGLSHFRSKKTSRQMRRKASEVKVSPVDKKQIMSYL